MHRGCTNIWHVSSHPPYKQGTEGSYLARLIESLRPLLTSIFGSCSCSISCTFCLIRRGICRLVWQVLASVILLRGTQREGVNQYQHKTNSELCARNGKVQSETRIKNVSKRKIRTTQSFPELDDVSDLNRGRRGVVCLRQDLSGTRTQKGEREIERECWPDKLFPNY